MSDNKFQSKNKVNDIDVSSVDDFIKQLEEKERDLDISSDLVIEVDKSEVGHNNIHDSFIADSSELTPETTLDSEVEKEIASQLINKSVPSESKKEDLAKDFEKIKSERDQIKDSLVRHQRDFDNYRSRTERERNDTFKNVIINVGNQLLPVIDNLDRALDASSSADVEEDKKDFQTFVHGIVLVNQQINEVLVNMGIKPILAKGKPFDPLFHEAVATEETDEFPPKTVIEEILVGYQVDDTVIRPSMVKVSTSVSPDKKEPEE